MEKTNYKIIFLGTPEFGAIVLDILSKTKFKPLMVITEPDKPAGRKKVLTPPPVKKIAIKYNIPTLQPKRNNNYYDKIKKLKPDLFIVAAYGKILSENFLDIPKFGSLNIHPSILPKYRGASPIQTAILNNDKETGITIILMDKKMDHGPIVNQLKFKIENQKITYQELSEKLAKSSAELLINTLPQWFAKKIQPKNQDNKEASYCWQIKKEDGKIDWTQSAEKIERMTRAYWPWPSAWTELKIKNDRLLKLKIVEASVLPINYKKKIGTIFLFNKQLAIVCGKNTLIIEKLQLEGKKIMTAKDFLNGHPKIIECILN